MKGRGKRKKGMGEGRGRVALYLLGMDAPEQAMGLQKYVRARSLV